MKKTALALSRRLIKLPTVLFVLLASFNIAILWIALVDTLILIFLSAQILLFEDHGFQVIRKLNWSIILLHAISVILIIFLVNCGVCFLVKKLIKKSSRSALN
jgi:hypothetical protein